MRGESEEDNLRVIGAGELDGPFVSPSLGGIAPA